MQGSVPDVLFANMSCHLIMKLAQVISLKQHIFIYLLVSVGQEFRLGAT